MSFCQVQASPMVVGESSTYQFTIILNSTPLAELLSPGDTISTTFPPEVTITDSGTPTVCYRSDSGTQIAMPNCKITSNTISFEIDAEIDTGVSPLVYFLGNAKNPPAVITTASFQVVIYHSGTMLDNYTTGLTATYTAGTLTGLAISSSTYTVYTQATITLTFIPQHDIPKSARVFISFPSDFEMGSVTFLDVKGMIGISSYLSMTALVPSSNTINASGLFDSAGLTAASGFTVSITIYPVNTPNSKRDSGSVSLYTATTDGYKIDSSAGTSLKITITTARSFSSMIVTPSPYTVLKGATYTFTITPDIGFPDRGKLAIIVPTSVAIGSISCSYFAGFSDSADVSKGCILSGTTISTMGVYFNKGGSTQFLNFQISGFTNPPDTVPTTNFKFQTYDSSGYLMCENLSGPQITATVNAITGTTAVRPSSKVSAAGPYKLTFSTSTKIPQFAKIKIVIPTDQIVPSPAIECYQVSAGVTLTTNVCSGTVTTSTSPSTYTILITEYCSTGPSGCPSGTQFVLSFSSVANQPYVKTITTSVEIYTLNSAATGGIDSKSTGIVFLPALVPETILDAAVSRIGDTVGQNAILYFSFTPPITFVANVKIALTFPQELAYPDDAGAIFKVESVDSSYSNPVALTYSGLTQYSDTSYTMVTISTACPSGCVLTTKLYFKMSNWDNKPMVKTIGTTYALAVTTTEGYNIATGTVTSTGVGVLLPGALTSLTISRTSNSIQTPVSIDFSFTHPTIMSTTSEINLTFPDKLLLEGTGLTCKRKSDSVTVTCTKTTFASGAINTLKITGYCSAACAVNTSVQVTFGGLKTYDYVTPITGAISANTKDSTYLIDQGTLADITTQISPLVPGTLINVSILQDNPTTGASTTYRILFTPSHSIPAGAQIQVSFPAEVSALDRSTASASCSTYIQLDTGLQCSVTSKVLTVTGGFPTAKNGSWMLGFKVSGVTNGGAAGTSSAFGISLTTSDGSAIDSGSGTASFYSPLGTCAVQCLTCAGSDSTCYSCSLPGASPLQSDFSCLQTCPGTAFLLSTPTPLSCIQCHYTCATCDSSLNSSCLSCASGLYKSNRSCVSQCPSGTSLQSGACISTSPCTSPCLTCSTSPTFCLTCDSASANPVLNSKDGTCVATQSGTTQYCPDGYYQSAQQCLPCSYSCSKCLNTSTYCTACKTIYALPYLNMIDNSCVATCPPNVTVLVSTTCVKCDVSCATCSGTTSTDCVTCPTTGTKYKTTLNQCVASCAIGTFHFDNADGTFSCIATCDTTNKLYIDSANRYCRSCYATCLTCSAGGQFDCLTCDTTTNFKYFGTTGECLTVCPATQFTYSLSTPYRCYVSCPQPYYNFVNASSQKVCINLCPATQYYIDTATNTCSPCASSCLTCTGPQQNNCSSCDLKGATAYFTSTNYCLAQCPPDMYIYELNSSKKCFTVCPSIDSYNYDNPTTGTKQCINSCVGSFWIDVPNNYCKPCYLACKTCNGGTAFQCVSCDSTGTYKYLTYQNECVTACDASLYISGFTCLQTCPTNTFYYDNPLGYRECVTACNTGWVDTVNRYCKPCDPSCATCSGGTSFTCTTCYPAAPFLTFDNQCVATCPATTFIYTLNSSQKCLSSCPVGTYYFKNPDNSVSCVATCNTSNKYFVNTTTNYCSPCDTTCLTCKDASNLSCLSCDPTLFLTADGQCLATCPANQYAYTVSGAKKCYISCPTPTYNFVDGSGNWVCATTCNTSNQYFIDTATNTCSPCYLTCLTCSAGGSKNCISCGVTYPLLTDDFQCVTSCPSTMYLYNGKCVITCPGGTYYYTDQNSLQKCVTTCDTGFYLDVTNRHCYQCFSTCLTCSGIAVNNCVTCAADKWLSDSNMCLTSCGSLYQDTVNRKCYITCPVPLYNYIDTANGSLKTCISTCFPRYFIDSTNTCTPCDSTCLTCNGTTATSCLSCDPGIYLTDTGMCVAVCPVNMYLYDPAKRCYTTCPPGSLFNFDNTTYKQCITSCTGKFYIDSVNNYCIPCYSTCLTCGGSKYTDCLTCDIAGSYPYLTSDGQCVVTCPLGSYTLEAQKKCFVTCPTGYYKFVDAGGNNVCTNTCAVRYFIDYPNQFCRPCYSTCLTCKDTTYQGCLSCDATLPFLTDTGECVLQCSSTMYRFTFNSKSLCYTNCPAGYYNFDNTAGYKECLDACGNGFFVVTTPNTYCYACNASCKTCADATSCSSCYPTGTAPFLPYLTDTKQCVSQCIDPYPYQFVFPPLDLRCYSTCPTSYFNFINLTTSVKECIASCGNGYYVESGTNICKLCNSTCKTCSAGTASDCTSCDVPTPYLTDTKQCLIQCLATTFVYTIGGAKLCYTNCPTPSLNYDNPTTAIKECTLTCPAKNYIDTSNAAYSYCRPCAASCLTCNGTTAQTCLSCDTAGSTPLLTETHECVSQCPATMYKYTLSGPTMCYTICPSSYNYVNPATLQNECKATCDATANFYISGNFCIPCFSTCLTCKGATASDCLSCNLSGTTPFLTDTNQCVSSCSDPSPFQYIVGTDRRCYSNCPANYYNFDNPTLGIKQCIASCPAQYYLDVNYCKPCYTSCKTCNGTTNSSCLTCITATPLLTDANQCVVSCPITMYLSIADSRCYVNCPSGQLYYDDPITATKECIASCPAQHFIDTSLPLPNYCRPCDTSCLTCNGTTSSNCLTCVPATPMLTDASQCVLTCPTTMYAYAAQNRCYVNCPSATLYYDNPTTARKECVASCPVQYFIDTSLPLPNYCRPCDTSCLTCSGTTNSNCLTCVTATPMLTDANQCLVACPATMYAYTAQNRCYVNCPSGTLYYDNPTTSKKECVASCPVQYFIDTSPPLPNYCRPCDTSCLTCSGTTNKSCVTCMAATPMLTWENACVAVCPSTMYAYAAQSRCYSECPRPSYNFLDPNTNINVCTLTCGDKFFVQIGTTSDSCLPCYTTCKTCNGVNNNQCLSCDILGANPFFTDDNMCVAQCPSTKYTYTINGEKRCYTTCPGTSFNFLNPLTAVKECIQQCVTAVFYDSVDNMCKLCHSTCKSCNGVLNTNCLTCDATGLTPYLTSLNQCVSDCPVTLYKYTLNGAHNCFTTCPLGTYNYDNPAGYEECIAACGSGNFIQLPNTCKVCYVSCLSCSDSTNTGCLTCNTGGLTPFLSYTGECLAQCPNTDYRYDIGGVKKCMTSCPAGSYAYSNPGGYLECIAVCGPGYYLDSVTSKCTLCYVTCLTCGGTSSTSCLTCSLTGSFPFLSETGECVTSCGTLYQYTLNSQMMCVSSCPTGSFMYTPPTGGKKCVTVCGAGFYLDLTTKVCSNCDQTCATCDQLTSSDCVTCDTAGAFPYLTETGTCVSQCAPLYQYTIGGSKMCYAVCPGGSYGFTNPSGLKECISACGPGYYLDLTANTCTLCYPTCLNCIGVGATKCSSCSVTGQYPFLTDTSECLTACGGLYMYKQSTSWRCLTICPPSTLYFDYLTGEHECVTTCSSTKYFIDTAASYCRPCDSTCLTCSGSSNAQCLTCDTTSSYKFYTDPGTCMSQCSLTLFRYTLNSEFRCYTDCPGSIKYNNPATGLECIQACPPGTYYDSGNNYCKSCNASCLTCNGTSNTDCLSCNKAGLNGFYTDTKMCVPVCPTSLYIYNPNGEKLCKTTCPVGSFNYNNIIGYKECVLTCGIGSYVSGTNDCLPCDLTCRTCTGGANNMCVTCDKTGANPYYTENLTCVSSCPATSYIYNPNGEMKCVTVCPFPYYNSANPAGYLECLSKCGSGFYVDTASQLCKPCYPTCLTCTSGTSLSCSSCDPAGSFPYATDDGACVAQCPSQYFYYTSGSTTLCVTTCPMSTFKYNNPQGFKQCVSNCNTKMYIDLTVGSCVACYPSCMLCSGPLETDCTLCDLNTNFKYLTNGKCLSVCPSTLYVYTDKGTTTCYSICPNGTYQLDLGGKQCVLSCPGSTYLLGINCVTCDKSCATCSSTGDYSCIQCNVGFISNGGQCVSSCPTGYKEYFGKCVPVCKQTSCVTCDAATVFTCQQCVPGFILYQSTCFETCPDGTFQSLSTCQVCDKICNTCKGSKASDCVSCFPGNSMYMGGCVSTCPTGLQSINGRCLVPTPCELPCTTCLDNSADVCSACQPANPYLVSSKCYEQCPDHYYAIENSKCSQCAKECVKCSGPLTVNCLSCPTTIVPMYYLTPTGKCDLSCPEKYYANNDTHVCQSINYFPFPTPANITLPEAQGPNISKLEYRKSVVYPVTTLGSTAAAGSLLMLASRVVSPQSHISEANLLALYSAVDMTGRAGLVVALWRYGDISPAPFEIAISSGLVMGSVCLSMMFLVLYMDPVFESSAAMDVLTTRHKWGVRVVRGLSYVFGLHFLRILYGGLFGLSLFSNFKTLGTSSGFRLPLEKLSSIHLIALIIPQIILNTTVLLFYEIDSDPFQLAALGIGVDLAIAGIYLFDYYRGPWRS